MPSHWLSLAVWVPIVAGFIVLAVGDRNLREARGVSLLGAIVGFLVTIPLVTGFRTGTSAMQFVELSPWIPRFNVNYHLGVDGISVLFILLNSFITVLVVIAGWEVIRSRVAQYMAAFLVMSGLLNGTFAALDAVLFYVFFEATLIPMYLVIGVWGGPNRVYAAVKFFLYTLLGSLLMLVAFLYLYNKSGGSFAVLDYHKLPLPLNAQILLFIAFLMAFAVKVPMWPVHTWLPDAHVEAPTGGSAVLAAILLKLGAYGFVRFSLPILPDASHYLAGFMITLSLIAIVYIGLVALVQTDMTKRIAFLAGTTLVFGAAYTLWMYKRVIFGEAGNKQVAELSDANTRELLVLGLLAIAVLWLGLHPAPFTEIMHASVNELLKHLAVSKL